jgi:hypothetical protein
MFYVYDLRSNANDQAIRLPDGTDEPRVFTTDVLPAEALADEDIDFVDDALLNTAPHNAIEHQLFRGDVVGLALMSGAIIWSAMGAFG